MFEIGFWELSIIAVVALLVIGPERLPGVARTVGVWVGRVRRFVHSVQEDVNREINRTEKLKNLLEDQVELKEMHDLLQSGKADEYVSSDDDAQEYEYLVKSMPTPIPTSEGDAAAGEKDVAEVAALEEVSEVSGSDNTRASIGISEATDSEQKTGPLENQNG